MTTATVIDKDGFTIEYFGGLPDPQRLADVWYQGEGTIAYISKDGFGVYATCEGDMKYTIGDESARGTDLLRDNGITTDDELQKANNDERINWDMNPWFNLQLDNEEFDIALGDLPDIIQVAKDYITEQIVSAEIIMRDGVLTTDDEDVTIGTL